MKLPVDWQWQSRVPHLHEPQRAIEALLREDRDGFRGTGDDGGSVDECFSRHSWSKIIFGKLECVAWDRHRVVRVHTRSS